MSYHKPHECALDFNSDKVVLEQPRQSGLCQGVRRSFLISKQHPATYKHFRSYPMLVAERQRQQSEGGRCIIHPLSCISLYWNSIMVVVNLSHICVSTFRLTFVLHRLGHRPEIQWVDHLLLALHLICFFDVIVKCHMGYLVGNANVVLDNARCTCLYIKRYFFIDLISCLPISYLLLYYEVPNTRYILVGHLIAILRIFTICREVKNFVIFIKRFNGSYMVYGSLRNILLFLLSAHLLSCFNFLHGSIIYHWSGTWPYGYSKYLTNNSSGMPNLPTVLRYKKAAFVCFSALLGTGLSMYPIFEPIEILVNIFTILYSALFMLYTLVYLIKVYFTKHHSQIRYYELMNQLKEYMKHKQFPASLKKRVFAFYYYQFQGTYFREDTVLASLSDQLRNEIALHTCHKLVDKVALFDGLPADVVGSILGCLRPEVYLPNDLVVRAGDIGDCMYLIANGTVAVYSLKGVEVCHLEDGAYFGEVALLMKDSKRVATVVAVEITQVFRLDAEHFRYFIETYEDLHERIEVLASQRMHETVVLDEAFKRDREREHTHSGEIYHQILSRMSPTDYSTVDFSRSTIHNSFPRSSDSPK